MGLFNSAKNVALKTKLRGENTLLDREIMARQKALGVELYNLLVVKSDTSVAGVKTPSIFHANQSRIQEPFDACRFDIRRLMEDKDCKEREIVHIEANRERSRPGRDHKEKLAKASTWIADTGTEAKLTVLIKKLERDMKLRKEQFGLDVFEILKMEEAASAAHSSPEKAGVIDKVKGGGKNAATGIKSGIASRLSKMSKSENEIEACIEAAKKDVATIVDRKNLKLREIARLDREA